MADRNFSQPQSDRDLLVSRPNAPLPTAEDPNGPHAGGYSVAPKPRPQPGQGLERWAADIGYTA